MTRSTGHDADDFQDFESDPREDAHTSEAWADDGPFGELLASHTVPTPGAAFVDDTLLRLALRAHDVPDPSPDFVVDTLLRQALHQHAVPAPRPDFVDRVLAARAAGPAPVALEAAGRGARRSRETRQRPAMSRRRSLLLTANLLAAAVVIALLPLLRPNDASTVLPKGGLPNAVLPEPQARALFAAHLQPAHFATRATNPLARSASLAREEKDPRVRGRLAITLPRTFETADRAAFEPGELPFALDFELGEND